MRYHVTEQYARGQARTIARFVDLKNAEIFVQVKLEQDANLAVKTIYGVYSDDELVKEYDGSSTDASDTSSAAASQGAQGKASGFTPSPFSTTPRPAGAAQKWLRDEDESEEKNK